MNTNINNSNFFYKISNIWFLLFLFLFSTHFAQQSPTITPLPKDSVLPSVAAIPKDSLIPQNKSNLIDSILPLAKNKNTKPSITINKAITTTFVYSNIDYTEYSSISNVLKVINNKKEACTIKVKVSLPSGWKSLLNAEKTFNLEPFDSIFIPIRMIANSKKIKGGVKYGINAIVTKLETGQVFNTSFLAGKDKISRIGMQITPQKNIYLLNNEKTASFNLEISNEGEEDENLFLTLNKFGKDIMVSDSSGKFLKKNYIDLKLKPLFDTLIPFKVSIYDQIRNQKRVDNYDYTALQNKEAKHYKLFIKGTQPLFSKVFSASDSVKKEPFQILKNIEIIKLLSVKKVNPYGSSCMPVTFISNINFNNRMPVINNIFNGRYAIDENSNFSFILQNSMAYGAFDIKDLKNTFFLTSYNNKKIVLNFGQNAQSGMPFGSSGGNGLGLGGSYQINEKHQVGASISKTIFPINNQNNIFSYGLGYSGLFNKLRVNFGFSQQNISQIGNTYVYGSSLSFPIRQSQKIGFQLSFLNNKTYNQNAWGQNINTNYTISYLKNQASSNFNFSYSKNPIINSLSINNFYTTNLMASVFNQFNLKNNYFVNSNHSYIDIKNSTGSMFVNNNNISITNNVLFGKKTDKELKFSPGVYSNYINMFNQKTLNNGLLLNISKSIYETNQVFGINLRSGIYKVLNTQPALDFFTGQANFYYRYKVWNFNFNYNYGPQGQNNALNDINQTTYPQYILFLVSNQHQFKNTHFLLESNLNYKYSNINERQNFSLFSQLFYYTNNGWRFNVNLNYNYFIFQNIKMSYDPNLAQQYFSENTGTKTQGYNLNWSFGIKKDFCIPLPKRFAKKRFVDVVFKTFLDLNGNKKFDVNEIVLENVVVNLGKDETQTNALGEVKYENVQLGKYKLSAFPLEEIGAWFAIIKDSVDINVSGTQFIPFSQGVRVLGNIELDREKFSLNLVNKLDISRLKIFLRDSSGNNISTLTDYEGNFKFYTPKGKYTLAFDEAVLGSDFELAENDIELDLSDGVESYYHTFYILQKRRKVKAKKFSSEGTEISSNNNQELLQRFANTKKENTSKVKNIDAKNEADLAKDRNDSINNVIDLKNRAIKLSKLDSLTTLLNSNINDNNRNDNNTEKLKLLAQEIRNELGINFSVELETIPLNQLPNGLLRQMIRLNSVDTTLNNDGSKKYYTGSYKTVLEAEQEALKYRKKGFKKAQISTQKVK